MDLNLHNRLLSGGYKKNLNLWAWGGTVEFGRKLPSPIISIQQLKGHFEDTVAVACDDGFVRICKMTRAKKYLLDELKTNSNCDGVFGMEVNHEENLLFTGGFDEKVQMFKLVHGGRSAFENASGNMHIRSFGGHNRSVNSIKCLVHPHRFASGSSDETIKVFDFDQVKCLHTFKDAEGIVSRLDVDRRRNLLFSTNTDQKVRVYDLTMKKLIASFDAKFSLSAIVYVEDLHMLFFATNSKSNYHILGLDLRNARELHSGTPRILWKAPHCHTHYIWRLIWLHDREMVASSSADCSIRLFSLDDLSIFSEEKVTETKWKEQFKEESWVNAIAYLHEGNVQKIREAKLIREDVAQRIKFVTTTDLEGCVVIRIGKNDMMKRQINLVVLRILWK